MGMPPDISSNFSGPAISVNETTTSEAPPICPGASARAARCAVWSTIDRDLATRSPRWPAAVPPRHAVRSCVGPCREFCREAKHLQLAMAKAERTSLATKGASIEQGADRAAAGPSNRSRRRRHA
eukprot:scaffold308477_cov26-Tisochrysis_lutea.AAC.3